MITLNGNNGAMALLKKAGTIPIQIVDGTVMVCLVSSRRRKGKFVLPKGTVYPNEKRRQAAQRETLEEAGLKGALSPSSIKVNAATSGADTCLQKIKFFAMLIEEVLDEWPEQCTRERRWVDLNALPEPDMIKRDIEILKSQKFQMMVEELLQQA